MPDGTKVLVNGKCRRAPDLLFNPHLGGYEVFGFHKLVHEASKASKIDEVILAGANTLFFTSKSQVCMATRLQSELQKLGDKNKTVLAPPDRKYAAWIGASLWSTMEGAFYFTKAQYEEYGPKALTKSLNGEGGEEEKAQ